ncbi:hypothetical protein QJS66_23400 (plasmid) [Kocuria rhizophila]|nr:hypothetical protein QJS66_23400 [Kocuria rhizophila]
MDFFERDATGLPPGGTGYIDFSGLVWPSVRPSPWVRTSARPPPGPGLPSRQVESTPSNGQDL